MLSQIMQDRVAEHREASVDMPLPWPSHRGPPPNENKSVRASSSLARTCSGDMYATVPNAVPGLVRCASAIPVSVASVAGLFPVAVIFARPNWQSACRFDQMLARNRRDAAPEPATPCHLANLVI